MALRPVKGNSIRSRFQSQTKSKQKNKKKLKGCHLLAPRSRCKILLIDCFPVPCAFEAAREKLNMPHREGALPEKSKGAPIRGAQFENHQEIITNRFQLEKKIIPTLVSVCLHQMCKTTTTTTIFVLFCLFLCLIIFSIGFQGLLCFTFFLLLLLLNTDNETKRFSNRCSDSVRPTVQHFLSC